MPAHPGSWPGALKDYVAHAAELRDQLADLGFFLRSPPAGLGADLSGLLPKVDGFITELQRLLPTGEAAARRQVSRSACARSSSRARR